MNETQYDVTSAWYTQLPKDIEQIEKVLLILNSLDIRNNTFNSKNLLTKTWIGYSHSKNLNWFTSVVNPQDFKESNYNYIPFEYLLTL